VHLATLRGYPPPSTVETTVFAGLVRMSLILKERPVIIRNIVGESITGQNMYEQYAVGYISPFGDGQGVF